MVAFSHVGRVAIIGTSKVRVKLDDYRFPSNHRDIVLSDLSKLDYVVSVDVESIDGVRDTGVHYTAWFGIVMNVHGKRHSEMVLQSALRMLAPYHIVSCSFRTMKDGDNYAVSYVMTKKYDIWRAYTYLGNEDHLHVWLNKHFPGKVNHEFHDGAGWPNITVWMERL